MEGTVTISIDKLDYYRGLEDVVKHYKARGIVETRHNSYGRTGSSYHCIEDKHIITVSENRKETIEIQVKELKEVNQKISCAQDENSRLLVLNQLLKESKRPIEISNFHFGILGFALGLFIVFLNIWIWN